MTANDERQLGRAKNGVLSFFERKLSVPRIYFDAVWSNQKVDVLAIDRDGVGDVHAALLFVDEYFPNGSPKMDSRIKSIEALYGRFANIPAQFKYLVAVEVGSGVHKPLSLSPALSDQAFSPDGIGRIGLASVEFLREDEPQTKLLVKPERFRAKVAQLADEFVEKYAADWEIRA
jgi:hypothetical protein